MGKTKKYVSALNDFKKVDNPVKKNNQSYSLVSSLTVDLFHVIQV